MTTTIEMAAWLDRQSKMAIGEKCPKAAAQLDAIAQRLRPRMGVNGKQLGCKEST